MDTYRHIFDFKHFCNERRYRFTANNIEGIFMTPSLVLIYGGSALGDVIGNGFAHAN
jgi:hypothetical protein